MRQARITFTVYDCNSCPHIIKGRLSDWCNIADKELMEVYGVREIPEWCPCLCEENHE